MRRRARLLVAAVVTTGMVAPAAQATPIDNQASAVRGANRLLEIQSPDGTFPFIVGNPVVFENVQGITALGLIEAFKVSGDFRYTAASGRTRNWLRSIAQGGPCPVPFDSPPCRLSSASIYFLAEQAVVTANPLDFAVARAALDEQLASFGGPAGLVNGIISARKHAQLLGNLGLWDVGLYIRAAQDVGRFLQADAMANALITQTIANPLDSTQTYYELGLAGVVLGLAEADVAAYALNWTPSYERLKSLQASNGSLPVTFAGTVYPDDTQSTAYGVMAFAAVGDIPAGQKGAGFIRSVQRPNGGFAPWLPEEVDPLEYGEVDAEAIGALVAATLLVPGGAVNHADVVRQV